MPAVPIKKSIGTDYPGLPRGRPEGEDAQAASGQPLPSDAGPVPAALGASQDLPHGGTGLRGAALGVGQADRARPKAGCRGALPCPRGGTGSSRATTSGSWAQEEDQLRQTTEAPRDLFRRSGDDSPAARRPSWTMFLPPLCFELARRGTIATEIGYSPGGTRASPRPPDACRHNDAIIMVDSHSGMEMFARSSATRSPAGVRPADTVIVSRSEVDALRTMVGRHHGSKERHDESLSRAMLP